MDQTSESSFDNENQGAKIWSTASSQEFAMDGNTSTFLQPEDVDDVPREHPSTRIDESSIQGADSAPLPELESDRYRIVREIGSGGAGRVYLAEDTRFPRDVAVKVLAQKYQSNQPAIQSFSEEASIISYLSHSGVPPIHESGTCLDGRPYHVMKLIEGMTLAAFIRQERPTLPELFAIFADVCDTLAFAHSMGIVHLDLKPSNIMLDPFGNVYVMDWGLSRYVGSDSARICRFLSADSPAEGKVVGTWEYMAPEQAAGVEVDERADVFSLGAMLCEMLIGQPPYQRPTPGEESIQVGDHRAIVMTCDFKESLQQLDACDSDFKLARLAKQCLSKKRDARPSSAVELARQVSAYQVSALEQARGDLSCFFELSLDLFCIANFDGFFTRINSNFSQLLGHSEKDLLEKPFLEYVHPQDRMRTGTQMSVLLQGQPVVRFRNRYRTQSGNYLTMEWTAQTNANRTAIFAVARDVSKPLEQ